MNKTYIAIDLKSFYASVECVSRNLDPLKTNLVVADLSRTEKTICLAVSPSLKKFKIGGRARLFEVVQRVKEINRERLSKTDHFGFEGSSFDEDELIENNNLSLDYIVATPRMAEYINVSTKIYKIYLKYIAPEDIHVYSIDEVFIDASKYLALYKCNGEELARKLILDVLKETGITATAGIGENLYLAKVAMDIVAKHISSDENGVRISSLTEMEYRQKLWDHRPLKDFWRVGIGYVERLEKMNLFTMGDIARMSLENEDLLYKEFGINAELLIDHAWGYEPVTIKKIKNYKPKSNSLSSGQVLACSYDYEKCKVIIFEMADLIALDLVRKNSLTNNISLMIGYDRDGIENNSYKGEIKKDYYGRISPKPSNASKSLEEYTSSSKVLVKEFLSLYEEVARRDLKIKRISISVNNLLQPDKIKKVPVQLSLFSNYENIEKDLNEKVEREKEEKSLQGTLLKIQEKFGKNSVLKAKNYVDGGTTRERNKQIGGHKA